MKLVSSLLPLLTSGDRFFVLALSQHKVRLFEATEYQIERVEVAGLQRIVCAEGYIPHHPYPAVLGLRGRVSHRQQQQEEQQSGQISTAPVHRAPRRDR